MARLLRETIKGKRVCVSDVDGTLLRGSAVLQHAIFLESKGIINLGGVGNDWLDDRKNERLIMALAEVYKEEIRGLTEEQLLIDEFFVFLEEDDKNNFIYTSIDLLLNENIDVVILMSGSPTYLLNALKIILEEYLNKPVFVVGSEYEFIDNKLTGNILLPMFSGVSKEKALAELELDDIEMGLGDTVSDFPILRIARHGFLIDPTNDTLRKALLDPTLLNIKTIM